MYTGTHVFSQLMAYLPIRQFRKCDRRSGSHYNSKTKSFSCLDHFLCMAFAQLTYRASLRDIEAYLQGMQLKLYHMGICREVFRITWANANEKRDWRIYAGFAQILNQEAKALR